LTIERIRLTFDFDFDFFISFFFNNLFSLPFHAFGRVENALFLATTLQGFTKPVMLTLELIKRWGSWCALDNVLKQ
jgi:hypothetical protein